MPRQLRNSGKVSEKRPSSCPRARRFGRTGTLRTLNVSSAPRTKSSSRQSCSGGSSRIILRQDLHTEAHLARVCGGNVAKTRAATSNGRWLSSGACSARGLALAAHPSSGEHRDQLSGDSQAMRSSEDIPRARYFRPLCRDRVRGADREWREPPTRQTSGSGGFKKAGKRIRDERDSGENPLFFLVKKASGYYELLLTRKTLKKLEFFRSGLSAFSVPSSDRKEQGGTRGASPRSCSRASRRVERT